MRRSALRIATLEECAYYGQKLPRGLLPPIAGGAGLYGPPSVGTVVAWYAADLITGVSNGAQLPLWFDNSVNRYHVSQSGANEPTYNTNQQNGLPTVNFNGGPWMQSAPGATTNGPMTVFAVAQAVSNGQFSLICGYFASGGLGVNTSFQWYISSVNGTNLVSTVSPSGGYQIVTAVLNGANSIMRINGIQILSGNSGAATAGTQIFLGYWSGLSSAWDGSIGEVIFYNGALRPQEYSAVENYLYSKWFTSGGAAQLVRPNADIDVGYWS